MTGRRPEGRTAERRPEEACARAGSWAGDFWMRPLNIRIFLYLAILYIIYSNYIIFGEYDKSLIRYWKRIRSAS